MAGTIILAAACVMAGGVIGFMCAALCVAAGKEDDRRGLRSDDA